MANRKTTNAANQKKNSDPLAKYPLEIQEYLRLPEGTKKDYDQFVLDFTTFAGENQKLISRTLSNIFTMREIGNKTHGDLAEIAINEFINQYMASMGYRSIHVGKAFYRNKEHEEDIGIIKDKKTRIPVSLKAYGNGPLQLSTDKDSRLFTLLKTIHSTQSLNSAITNRDEIEKIFSTPAFSEITALNIMPLIYKEKDKKCNIMIFDVEKAKKETARIEYVPPTDASVKQRGKKREYPIFQLLDKDGHYICEVRYGKQDANALQRGFWTNTNKAESYFTSLTMGWIEYETNESILRLFELAMVSSPESQTKSAELLTENITTPRDGVDQPDAEEK